MKLNRNQSGFTLVELLIVVAIIGIIAAIAIPNLLSAIQRGKQKRTMGDMKTIGSALEDFSTDFNSYPHGGALADLAAGAGIYAPETIPSPLVPVDGMTPDYLGSAIWKDGWSTALGSNPLRYGSILNNTASGVAQYILCSEGKDNAVDGVVAPAAAVPAGCAMVTGVQSVGGDGTTFECDISMMNGQFIQQPAGKQRNVGGC